MEKNVNISGEYSTEEENLLPLSRQYKQTLESKENYGNSQVKESVWQKIETKYNAVTIGEPKHPKSLRFKYAMKKRETENDTTKKKIKPPKTKEKKKEKELEEVLIVDEDSALTKPSFQDGSSTEIKASTPRNDFAINKKENIDQPPVFIPESIADSNLDSTPIKSLPPQKIPIYDPLKLSSEIDEIFQNLMAGEKKDNSILEKDKSEKDESEEDMKIVTRNRPCRIQESVLYKQNRIYGKRLELLCMQKMALRQFMRHKSEEHKLKVKHWEVEHQLKVRCLGLSAIKKAMKPK